MVNAIRNVIGSTVLASQGGVDIIMPRQQGHSLLIPTRTETSETITWQNSFFLPTGYLVIYKSGSAVNSLPIDGISYNIGAELGTGNFVGAKVLSGDLLSVTLGSLPSGTQIYYRIVAYNGTGSKTKYRTSLEMGHLWGIDSAPPTGMIGADINVAKTLEVRSGSTTIYYRQRTLSTDAWGAWTLWDSIVGKAFHAIKICEGGTIHNASGTPVLLKVLIGDHLGSATIHAAYVPGVAFELVATGSGGQTWNDIAYNPNNSNATLISDSGTSRIATLTNARVASYVLTMDGNSIASVCHTNNVTIPTLICFKNPGTSGKGIAALISGVWTLRDTTVGKAYHMIRFCPGLGGSSTRIFCSSADGTGNDALWSDDYFATSTIIGITGEFGAFAFNTIDIVLAMFSRTAGADIPITVNGSDFELIDSPVANIVLFNGVADIEGFSACASSGTSLGIKTIPSNIANAETRFLDYVNWIAAIQTAGFAIGTTTQNNKVRDLSYAWQDGGYRNKVKSCKVYGFGSNVDAVTFNLKDATTYRSIKVNTLTFLDGSGIKSSLTSYMRSAFIPSVDASLNSFCILCLITDGSVNSKVIYGTNGSNANQRTSLNPRDAAGSLATVAMNSTAVAGAANPTSAIGAYANNRSGSTAAEHKIWKATTLVAPTIIDANNTTSVALSPLENFHCGLNNNGALSLADDTRYLSAIAECNSSLTDIELTHFLNALITMTL